MIFSGIFKFHDFIENIVGTRNGNRIAPHTVLGGIASLDTICPVIRVSLKPAALQGCQSANYPLALAGFRCLIDLQRDLITARPHAMLQRRACVLIFPDNITSVCHVIHNCLLIVHTVQRVRHRSHRHAVELAIAHAVNNIRHLIGTAWSTAERRRHILSNSKSASLCSLTAKERNAI